MKDEGNNEETYVYKQKNEKNTSKINDAVSFSEVVDVHMYYHNKQVPYYFQIHMVVMENHRNMDCKDFF
jgi:hypothetical protein